MRGVYTAQIRIDSTSAAKTLMYITAPATAIVEIIKASVTDADNATNMQIICSLQRIGTLGTPTATALTPSKHEAGDQAAASTVAGNVTASEPTYTANTQIGRQGAPSLQGWHYLPSPGERPTIAPGASLGLQLEEAPAAAFDAMVELVFREIG